MKHTLTVTTTLLLMFLASQILGLLALENNITVITTKTGEINITYSDTVIGERPDIKGFDSFLYIMFGVSMGTSILLILIALKRIIIWKMFYFLAVWMTTTVALGVFIDTSLALILCFILSACKLYRPDPVIYNLTELLIYAGVAVIFVPLLDILWISVLLIVISFYDVFAVWKSKHMIKIAKSLTNNNIFAGFMFPYLTKKVKKRGIEKKTEREVKTAVLGGGDVAFPLLFSGVVFNNLIKLQGLMKNTAFIKVMIIPLIVSVFLFVLFYKAKKDRYYPAMPFVTIGCFVGYVVLMII